MTYWILPWNKDVYDLPRSLATFGYVEWRQNNNFAVSDIVFLYCSSPARQIVYMMRVAKVNIPRNETINDEYLFKYKYKLKPADFYARFEPIARAAEDNPELSYARLQQLGIRSKLQGGVRMPDHIVTHILANFDVVYDDLSQTYTEGTAHRRSVTSYERNPQAREACLARYGYSCRICGLNFEQKYGEVGKDFIHVHHIDFISSSGGVPHDIDPVKDLIPVCPNCHAMLHRKVNGRYLSPAELKEMFGGEPVIS